MSAVSYCGTVGQTTTLRRARSHEITSARRCECRIAAHRINFTLCTGGVAMDWERISGNWAHWRERIQARWSRLTNYQLDKAAGRREPLLRQIQETYDLTREEADRQLRNWERNLAIQEFTERELTFADEDQADGTNGRG